MLLFSRAVSPLVVMTLLGAHCHLQVCSVIFGRSCTQEEAAMQQEELMGVQMQLSAVVSELRDHQVWGALTLVDRVA